MPSFSHNPHLVAKKPSSQEAKNTTAVVQPLFSLFRPLGSPTLAFIQTLSPKSQPLKYSSYHFRSHAHIQTNCFSPSKGIPSFFDPDFEVYCSWHPHPPPNPSPSSSTKSAIFPQEKKPPKKRKKKTKSQKSVTPSLSAKFGLKHNIPIEKNPMTRDSH